MAGIIIDQKSRLESKPVGEQLFEKHHDSDQSNSSDHEREHDESELEYQHGVRQARAITSTWNKQTLWLMFVLFYLVSFVDMLLIATQTSLNPYITSAFGKHGLLAAVSIIPTILGGTFKLTIAKIIDLLGRVEGFIIMVAVSVLGCIIKATCQNIEAYIAGHTLYWTAHLGLLFVIDVMLSDMTTLRNRMIILTVNYTPTIATTFAGPRVAELFYNYVNFRWAFGAFSFLLIGFSVPVVVIMLWAQRKAKKTGVYVHEPVNRTWWESTKYVFIQMDITGIFLITVAFALFLLPFSLAAYAPQQWKTGYIIAMLVLGLLFFPIFCLYERYLAPVPFLKWEYLLEPTIIGSCCLYAAMFASIFCWNSYMNSYLQVVFRLNISNAGYVLNSLSLTSAIFSPFIAWIIRATGNFKWLAYSGIPIFFLGTGLMIPFRTSGVNVGLVALCQVLVGLGSGIFSTCVQLAVMVPVTHNEISAVLAIQGLFGSIGAAIGIAIAGAIWNNTLPAKLRELLPEASKPAAMKIFASLPTQLAYKWGSPEREAIVQAYGHVQRNMIIAGVCFTPACLISVYIWRNINLKKLEEEKPKQTKGTVW